MISCYEFCMSVEHLNFNTVRIIIFCMWPWSCGADADIVLMVCVQLVHLSTDNLMKSLRNCTFPWTVKLC